MTPDEKINLAEQAKTLVDNPLLRKSIAFIKQAIFEDWEDAKTPEDREDLWRMQNAVTRFEGILLGYIQTGEIARKQLLEQKTFAQQVKRKIDAYR